MNVKICTIEGCAKPQVGKSLCGMHTSRKRRHGDPNGYVKPADRKQYGGPYMPRFGGKLRLRPCYLRSFVSSP